MACQDYISEPTDPGKIIILAGAGASGYLGVPTLDDLLEQARLGNDDIADRIRRTHNAVLAAKQYQTKAVFEELIVQLRRYLSIAEILRTDHLFRSEIGPMPTDVDTGRFALRWKEALTRCYRVLLTHYGPAKVDERRQSSEFQTTLKLLETLAKLNGNRLHIYTTNYDCSYQVLASNCKRISFMSHIDNETGRFSDGWFRSRRDLDDPVLPHVYVHRLHGCVGWFTHDGGLTEEIFGAGKHLEIIDDDMLPNMCLKLVTSQLVGTNRVFTSAFEELCDHLRAVDVLLVWGYSFRDLEVLRVINQAFSQRTRPFPVLYVDPYVLEERALTRIKFTLHDAPVPLDPRFKPKQIAWTTNSGYEQLSAAIVEALMEEGV